MELVNVTPQTPTVLCRPLFHRQHGGQERVSLLGFWRGPSVLTCAEKERQSLGFTVTICWTTSESSMIKLSLLHSVSIGSYTDLKMIQLDDHC